MSGTRNTLRNRESEYCCEFRVTAPLFPHANCHIGGRHAAAGPTLATAKGPHRFRAAHGLPARRALEPGQARAAGCRCARAGGPEPFCESDAIWAEGRPFTLSPRFF